MEEQPHLENDGERMVPEFHQPSLLYAEHVVRYMGAMGLVAGKRVLDIASGSGYGSHLLAASAASVVGVDVNDQAVAYARATYTRDNLTFLQGDATAIPVADASVDVVVTFETIEHIADYRTFLAEVARVLSPEGIAIISTPNDLEFVEDNHFHLHEFVEDELLQVVGEQFPHVESYYQATWTVAALGDREVLGAQGPVDASVVNLAPVQPENYLYFYLLCSRRPITERLSALVGLGAHHSDRVLQQIGKAQADQDAALRVEIAQHAAARDQALQDLAAVRATRSFRIAQRLSGLAGRLGLARSAG